MPPPLDRALDLSGRVVLVTGARAGLGAGIVDRFAEAGATVVRHLGRSRRVPAAGGGDDAAGSGGGGAAARARAADSGADISTGGELSGDLTDPAVVARLVGAVVERHGRLDVVVANAADQRLVPLVEQSAASWDEVLAANVTAVAELLRVAAPHLAADGGSLVAIASIEGLQPAPAHGAYAASKAALLQLVRAAAGELGPSGVRVNAVSPGLIDRPGLAEAWPEGVARWHAAAPLGRLGTPTDVADACLFLASPLARWITGANLVVDGGVLTHPTW